MNQKHVLKGAVIVAVLALLQVGFEAARDFWVALGKVLGDIYSNHTLSNDTTMLAILGVVVYAACKNNPSLRKKFLHVDTLVSEFVGPLSNIIKRIRGKNGGGNGPGSRS